MNRERIFMDASKGVMMKLILPTVVFALACTVDVGTAAADTPVPTMANVSYGPHDKNTLDFWQAEGEGPRPLVIYIHGGGWYMGNKSQWRCGPQAFLDKGISCAAINYRLTTDSPLPAPVHDAARAVQFLKSKAAEWNLRKDRFALTGGSAGACTAMWLLLHDDLADPNAEDPVLRESTRVAAAAAQNGQTSIDPEVLKEWFGTKSMHRMIYQAVGERSMAGVWKNIDKYRTLYQEFSPYNHLDKDDPPLLMTYILDATLPPKNPGHGIHHPVFGIKMKEKSDRVGHESHLIIKGITGPKACRAIRDFFFKILLK